VSLKSDHKFVSRKLLASCPSYIDSLKVLEIDIQFANMLAASIPRDKSGAFIRMEMVDKFPMFMFASNLLKFLLCSCT
ncbi:hypothetical protein M8C21_012738, partial [Ambrosia artemisiifolia]